MQRVLFVLAMMAIFIPQPASAEPFKGTYGGIHFGGATLKASLDGDSASSETGIGGAYFGFRGLASEKLVLGVEAEAGLTTNGTNFTYGASGIAGYLLTEEKMVYLRVGYTRIESGSGLNGLQFGGGYEAMINENLGFRVDYRYTRFEKLLGATLRQHQVTAGITIDF